MTEVCFDTSAWLMLTRGPTQQVKEIIDSDAIIIISTITLFEAKRKMQRDGVPMTKLNKTMSFIRYSSRIIDVTKDIAETAADLSVKHELSTADAIMYATALSKQAELITGDSDLAGLKGVKFIQ